MQKKLCRKILFTFLFFLQPGSEAYPQVWVENYSFDGNQLDSSKWSANVSSADGAYLVDQGELKYYQTASGSMPLFSFNWHRSLPLNHDWTILVRTKFSSLGTGDWALQGIDGGMAVAWFEYYPPQLSYGYRINAYGGNGSSSTGYQIDYNSSAQDSFRWIGISFNAADRRFMSLWSPSSSSNLLGTEQFNTIFDYHDQSNRTDFSFRLAGYWLQSTSQQSVSVDEFKIIPYAVPEPSGVSLIAVGLGLLFRHGRKRDQVERAERVFPLALHTLKS